MRNLDFKYLAAENFLCFGPEGIEVDLTQLGNIILVRGDNLDVHDEEERIASNGCGKSSIPEILVYTLFGKTIKKKLSHKNVINNKIGKKLRSEVRWDKYRVVRTRKPDTLRIWESEDGIWDDDTEISKGGMPATQGLVEEKIGLNYNTFVNVVVFTDDNSRSFLECDAASKREIVENLLSLEKYREYGDRAKKLKNKAKEIIKDIGKDYDNLLAVKRNCQERIVAITGQEKEWRQDKEKELRQLIKDIKNKREKLEATDMGVALMGYTAAQEKLTDLNESISAQGNRQIKVKEVLKDVKDRLDDLKLKKHQLSLEIAQHNANITESQSIITRLKDEISSLKSKKNTTCHYCHGVVKEENYKIFAMKSNNQTEHHQDKIEKENKLLTEKKETLEKTQTSISKVSNANDVAEGKVNEITNNLVAARREISELSKISKPVLGAEERILEDQIEELKKRAVTKKSEVDGPSPFIEILKSAKDEAEAKGKECEVKKKELEDAEVDLPYYEFWVKAFGDSGIRRFVIDGIIPALNKKIAHWLQFLIDNKIKLVFDNELEETIERNPADGDPFVYNAMSGGERQRLSLTVSQAFSHVMMLSSGSSPSLVFLDEVTTNIDPIGVVGVYNMILQLSKERQVFVTTHDQGLLAMLEGCETINLEKKEGFTTRI